MQSCWRADDPALTPPPAKGAGLDPAGAVAIFTVFSRNATRLEVWMYPHPRDAEAIERMALERVPGRDGLWTSSVPLATLRPHLAGGVYYGLRAWGPNWPYAEAWRPGFETGFRSDVDDQGHRFNPNKLLIDPYATEISHDPAPRLSDIDPNQYAGTYYSGPGTRIADTARVRSYRRAYCCLTRHHQFPPARRWSPE